MATGEAISAQFVLDAMASSTVEPKIEFETHRDAPRVALQVPVSCRALDSEMNPVGQSFDAVTLNLSASGVMLATKAKGIDTPHFIRTTFELTKGERACKCLQVLRDGQHGQYRAIAGKFVTVEH